MSAKLRPAPPVLCLCMTATILAGALFAGDVLAAELGKAPAEAELRFRPVRSAIYSRIIQRNIKLIGGLDKSRRIASLEGIPLEVKNVDKAGWQTSPDMEILRVRFARQSQDELLPWIVNVHEYLPGKSVQPRRDKPLGFWAHSGTVFLGRQGAAWMFGHRPAQTPVPRFPSVLYDHFRLPVLLIPVFPVEKSKVALGKEWTVLAPPPVYCASHCVKPPAEHVSLKQKWEKTVTLDGYKCAKISFEYSHRWKGDQNGLKKLSDIEQAWLGSRFPLQSAGEPLKKGEMPNWYWKWTGVVYFAIEEGVVVMEQSSVDLSDTRCRDVFRQNTQLLAVEALGDAENKLSKQPQWNYRYQKFHPKSEHGVASDASKDLRADVKVLIEAIKVYKAKHGMLPKTLQDIKEYPNVKKVALDAFRYEGRELIVTNEHDRCLLWAPIEGHPKWVLIGHPIGGIGVVRVREAKFLNPPAEDVGK
jgi:hypothetical protein